MKNSWSLFKERLPKQIVSFFLDCGEGRGFEAETMEGEDLFGWLIPSHLVEKFEKQFNADKVDSTQWAAFVVFVFPLGIKVAPHFLVQVLYHTCLTNGVQFKTVWWLFYAHLCKQQRYYERQVEIFGQDKLKVVDSWVAVKDDIYTRYVAKRDEDEFVDISTPPTVDELKPWKEVTDISVNMKTGEVTVETRYNVTIFD